MYTQSEVNNHYYPSLASEQTVHSCTQSLLQSSRPTLLGALCSRHLVPNPEMISLVMRGVDLISQEGKC